VLGDDVVGDAQTEPASLTGRLRREERVEDPRQIVLGNAWPIVGDLDLEAEAALADANREVPPSWAVIIA